MATIIFKPTEICNSNCVYCDVAKKHESVVMDYDLLELVFRRIGEYLRENPEEDVNLTWHGGEPTLLGHEYFRRAAEFQYEHCRNVANRLVHSVQSNLTRLTQEIVDVFRSMGISEVGSSYEPIPGIRGIGRNRDSARYNRMFFKGVRLLEQNEMQWGVIYVVTKAALDKPLELFSFLSNLNPSRGVSLNKVYIHGEDTHQMAISQEEYAEFLGKIFPHWWENQDRYGCVRPFVQITEAIRDGEPPALCEASGGCAYRWLYIGPQGEASHCGCSGDVNAICYGNVQGSSLDELLHNRQRDEIARRVHHLPLTECSGCRFWGLCHGGCPVDALLCEGSLSRRSPNCGWRKSFIEKYFEPVTGLRADLTPDGIAVG